MRQNQTQKLDRENRKSVMWRAIFGDMIEKDTSCVNFLEMQSRRKQTSYLSGITIINNAPHQCGSPLAPSAQRLLGRMRPSACDDGHVPGACTVLHRWRPCGGGSARRAGRCMLGAGWSCCGNRLDKIMTRVETISSLRVQYKGSNIRRANINTLSI